MLTIFGAAAGLHYRIPIIIVVVCVGLALFSAIAGLRMILTRTAAIPTSDSLHSPKEHHTGLSAQFWGILFLMFSVPLGAFGIGYWLDSDNPAAVVEWMFASRLATGLAIAAAGAGVAMYGLTRLLGGRHTFRETGLGTIERRFTGVYATLVGALIATAGVIHIAAPGTLTRMRDAGIAWALALAK
jgi:hypothetical protein